MDSLPLSCQGSSLEDIRLSKSEDDECVISLVCGIKRKNNKNEPRGYREHIGGCQKHGCGAWVKWMKGVKRYKLLITKYDFYHGNYMLQQYIAYLKGTERNIS